MAKVALYRKYRPQNFDELYGQDHIAKTMKNSIKSGSFSHAYLLCGPRGTGKTSVARILAKAINCLHNQEGNPDNNCDTCKLINDDKTMDIIEIDAASHTQVDNIREIIVERANFAPTKLKYKVYIIDEAHMLSKSSFNALLKTLEEPPEHAIFILATTEANKIIPTIVSRCQRFDFKRINQADMAKRLKFIAENEKIEIEDLVIEMIIEAAEGGFRDAISLLDQLSSSIKGKITKENASEILGINDNQVVSDLIFAFSNKDIQKSLSIISNQIENGLDVNLLHKDLINFYRLLLLAKNIGVNELGLNEITTKNIEELIKSYELNAIIHDLDILISTQTLYKNSSIPQLAIEVSAVKICTEYQNVVQKTVSSAKKETKIENKPIKNEVKITSNATDQVKWQQALLEIKSKNNSIHAFLKVCEPEFADETLKLHFPYKFHKERIEDNKNKQIVESALSKVSGKEYRIKCYLKPLSNHQVESVQPKKDDLLDDALAIFGGEVIE